MAKALRNTLRLIILTTTILAILFQVPIFLGLVSLHRIVCNLSNDSLSPIHTFSSRKLQNSSSHERDGNSSGFPSAQKRNSNITETVGLREESAIAGINVASSRNSKQPKPKYQLRPHGQAHYPFVQFSAYRASVRVFFVVGITSVAARSFDLPVYKCEWRPNAAGRESKPQPSEITDAKLIYVDFDQMPRIYVVTIVNCTFDDDVGMDAEGGSLFITVSVGPHAGSTEKVMVLQEDKEEAKVASMGNQDHSLPLKYAFCGPPMFGDIRGEWVLHWLVYHHYMWKDSVHFFFYNAGGITDSIRHLLNPFVDKGILTILDIEDEKKYPSWYYNQLMFVNDCLHRTRFLSSWTFFHDFDEFLSVSSPYTLDKLLDEHKDAPYLSFGSRRASLWLCADDTLHDLSSLEPYWPLQRMLWFEKQPFCDDTNQDPWLCVGSVGARKFVLNPRKVFAAGVHRTAIPGTGGVDLNASIARLNHYPGLASNKTTFCSFGVNTSMTLEELYRNVPSSQHYTRDDLVPVEAGKARNLSSAWLTTLL